MKAWTSSPSGRKSVQLRPDSLHREPTVLWLCGDETTSQLTSLFLFTLFFQQFMTLSQVDRYLQTRKKPQFTSFLSLHSLKFILTGVHLCRKMSIFICRCAIIYSIHVYLATIKRIYKITLWSLLITSLVLNTLDLVEYPC